MRSTLLCVLLTAACASSPGVRPANIPAARHEIGDAIAGDPGLTHVTADFAYEAATPGTGPIDRAAAAPRLPASRTIASMGRVTGDRAVVYTHAGDTRLEETWLRTPDGWRLGRVHELGGERGVSAAR